LTVPPSSFPATFPNGTPDAPEGTGTRGFVLIFFLGVVIRLFACQHTHIVNPDGVYYIHQAKAIYFGEWNSLTSCCLSFVSSYPFFVAGAYALFEEWVVAARFVSLFFGSMTLIPLHFLCKRFFEKDINLLTLLVFAMLPVFVSGSAEVIRDPVCWFFLSLGLYFFIRSYEKNDRLFLLFSCLSFLMASWARIESFVFILVGCVCLLTVPEERRIRKAVAFALPLMGTLLLILWAVIFLDKPLVQTLRLNDIVDKLSAPVLAYEALRSGLEGLMEHPLDGVTPHFLHKTRELVWLVALGTLVKYMIKAYFYLFFILFILGLGSVWHRLREDRRILYLSFAAVSLFVVFYLHVIQTWMMFDRFWAIFMLPAFMVVGFGLQKGVFLLTSGLRLKKSMALSILSLLILLCALPKDLKSREADKTIYKEIGELIAHREGNDREIRIVKSLRTPDWSAFYANLDYRGVDCPRTHFGMEPEPFDEVVFKDYEVFIGYLKTNNIPYFLWEEKVWPTDGFDFLNQREPGDLEKLGSWYHPDVGKIILYGVIS
jgi:hypothetical protein